MRDTIKNHKDFFMTDSDPVALSPYFVVRAKMAKFPDDPRYGVMATKRTFKLAVQRNRAKRLLRDWIRFNADLMASEYDYVFIARAGILNADRQSGRIAVSKALTHILHKYVKKIRSNETKNA